MNTKSTIEEIILQYPICEYGFGDTSQIPFSQKVRYICENECERYHHSWACPPHCGSIEDGMKKCLEYQHFLLFSTVTEVDNAWDTQICLQVKNAHEEITRAIRQQLLEKQLPHYVLSTGCMICETCACPSEPCRHPEQRLSSMESHGIVIMQLAEEMQLCYNYGGDTVVYFSMAFFND